MPESSDSDMLKLHEKAHYNAWKGQLYVQDQLVCDMALQSPSDSCIPAQLSEKLEIQKVIHLPELRKQLPKEIFEKTNFTGHEVCCKNVYYNFYQVLTSNVIGSQLDKLKKWMKDKELAIIKFLNDQGVLILLASTVLDPSKDLSPCDASSLSALFLFSHTRLLKKTDKGEWKGKIPEEGLPLKLSSLLPGLQYAIWETSQLGKKKELFPNALVERYFRKYAVLQKKKDTFSELHKHLMHTTSLLSDNTSEQKEKHTEEKCCKIAFAQLQSYILSPVNFCVSMLTASNLLTAEPLDVNGNATSCNATDLSMDRLNPSLATEMLIESKGKGLLNKSEKKKTARKGTKNRSRKSKRTSAEKFSPPSNDQRDKSNEKNNIVYSEDNTVVSSSSKTMLKLASAPYSEKRKRGAEVLTAEFVRDNQAIFAKSGDLSKKKKEELGSTAPKRIMPPRPKRNILVQEKPALPDRPPKRKASEPAQSKLSKNNLEIQRKLVDKHFEASARHSKRNLDKVKKEHTTSFSNLETSSPPGIPMENIFEKRMNMYESHALNLLADLALNSFSASGIPYAYVESIAVEHKTSTEDHIAKEKMIEEYEHERVNNPETSDPTPLPYSASHSQEPSPTMEEEPNKNQEKPSNDGAVNEVTSTSLPSMESFDKSVLSKVPVALAKAQSNVTSKLSLEHSYSKLPLDEKPVNQKECTIQIVHESNALPMATEVMFEPETNMYLPSEIILLTNDDQVLCPAVKKEPRSVLKFGDNFLITFNWDAKYDFDLDSKFTSNPLEKTINRALHGSWNPHLKEKVEDVKIILHMWLALFYSRPTKQQNCSSRKVVEHSNPAKYVSINTILDPFEFYEVVESDSIDYELTHPPLPSSENAVVNAPSAKESESNNMGKSVVHVLGKSEKKRRRNNSKDHSVLLQVAADGGEQACSNFEKMQENISQVHMYCKKPGKAKSRTKKEKSSAQERVHSTESEKKQKMDVSFQDVKKNIPRVSGNHSALKISFPLAEGDEQLERHNHSSVGKNMQDLKALPLQVVDENKLSSEGKQEAVNLDLQSSEYEIELGKRGKWTSGSETLVHVAVFKQDAVSDNKARLALKNEENRSNKTSEYNPATASEEVVSNTALGKKDTLFTESLTTNTDMETTCVDGDMKLSQNDNKVSNSEASETSKMEESNIGEDNLVIDLEENAKPSGSNGMDSDLETSIKPVGPVCKYPENDYGPSKDIGDMMKQPCVNMERKHFDEDDQNEGITIGCKFPRQLDNSVSDAAFKMASCKANISLEGIPDQNGISKDLTCENQDLVLDLTMQKEHHGSENSNIPEQTPMQHLVAASNEHTTSIMDYYAYETTTKKDAVQQIEIITPLVEREARQEAEKPMEICKSLPLAETTVDVQVAETANQVRHVFSNGDKANIVHLENTKDIEREPLATNEKNGCDTEVLNNDVCNLENMKESPLIEEQICLKVKALHSEVPLIPSVPHQGCDYGMVCKDYSIEANDYKTTKHTEVVEAEEEIPQHCAFHKTISARFQTTLEIGERIMPPKEVDLVSEGTAPTHEEDLISERIAAPNEEGIISNVIPPSSEEFISERNDVCNVNQVKSNLGILSDLFVDESNGDETARLVQNAINTLDQDLYTNTEETQQQHSLPDTRCVENHSERTAEPSEKVVSLDPVKPIIYQQLLSVSGESETINTEKQTIVEMKEKMVSLQHDKEIAIRDGDKCISDITDISMDCTSLAKDNVTVNKECEVILLEGNTSLVAAESVQQSAQETFRNPVQNNCTPQILGDFMENMEQDILQEHSDICFIASTASISEEQYERWSETSHEGMEFLCPIDDPQSYKVNVDAPEACPVMASNLSAQSSHEPTHATKIQSKSCVVLQETDRYLPRYHRDADFSKNYGNFIVTNHTKDIDRTFQAIHSKKLDLDSLIFNRTMHFTDRTQNTLDTEHLRFIHRLNGVLRNACTDTFTSESPSRTIFESRRIPNSSSSFKRRKSPLRITISSNKWEGRRRPDQMYSSTYYTQTNQELLMDRSSYHSRTTKKVRTHHRKAAPFHFSRLKYDNQLEKPSSDISTILKEYVQSNKLNLSRVSLGDPLTDRTTTRELADECVQTRKTFASPSKKVPAVKNIISDLCASLHSRLHSVVEECSKRNFRFYVHEPNDDPFFSQAKSLLKKDGHTPVEPQHFCNHSHVESDRLLVVIRNEDISSHVHTIPCLLKLKLLPNVSFVGMDSPEDITDNTYEELFQAGGFVVSDQSVLEKMSLGKLQEVTALLEKLNKSSSWKLLVHFRETRKLKEDKRAESESRAKILLLKLYQQMNIVEILPYHQCDSRLKAQNNTCVLNLQSQHIHSRLAVYLTDNPCMVTDELEHNGILVLDVDTFIRRIQKLDGQM
ncbi:protein TASOR 2 [Pelodytes ibericus]